MPPSSSGNWNTASKGLEQGKGEMSPLLNGQQWKGIRCRTQKEIHMFVSESLAKLA